MNRILIFSMLLAVCLVSAKCNDGCDPTETKCDGGAVYVCNSNQNWEKSLSGDCGVLSSETGVEFRCCLNPLDGVHSCLSGDEQCADENEGGQ